MHDLCSSVRTCRDYFHTVSTETFDAESLKNLESCVVNQLSEILNDEIHKLRKESGEISIHSGDVSQEAASIAGHSHYVYGILDLLQQLATTILSSELNLKIVELSLIVIEVVMDSSLQYKAFEILAKLSVKHSVGKLPIIQMVNDFLAAASWSKDQQQNISDQWRILQSRTVDAEQYQASLEATSAKLKHISISHSQVLSSDIIIQSYFARLPQNKRAQVLDTGNRISLLIVTRSGPSRKLWRFLLSS